MVKCDEIQNKKSLQTDNNKCRTNCMKTSDCLDQLQEEKKNSRSKLILKPCSDDFPHLVVTSHIGGTTVVERELVVDEKVTRKTEQYYDECTGETKLRTLEYIEKIVEKEVETTTEKIMCLELRVGLEENDKTDQIGNPESQEHPAIFKEDFQCR